MYFEFDMKSLKLGRDNVMQDLANKTTLIKEFGIEEQIPLFDCIFITGLCQDKTSDQYVPFTRDCFPDGVCNNNCTALKCTLVKNLCSGLEKFGDFFLFS